MWYFALCLKPAVRAPPAFDFAMESLSQPTLVTLTRMERPALRQLDFLDVLRGLAILMVFVYHCVGASFGRDRLPWGHWLRDFVSPDPMLAVLPAMAGRLGVAVFFVVSGFCIHLSYRRQPEWSKFYRRRIFRIYPLYLLTLVTFILWAPSWRLGLDSWADLVQIVTHAGLVHNLGAPWFHGINPSFWSIAVEVQLYAIYPALLLAVHRIGWKWTLTGLCILETTLRVGDGVWLTLHGFNLPKWISGTPFTYWFSWALGAFLAERHLENRPIHVPKGMIWAAVLATPVAGLVKPLSSLPFLFAACITAAVLAHMLFNPQPRLLLPPALSDHLRKAGQWSYSLYLWHQPLLFGIPILVAALFPATRPNPLLMFGLCLLSWFAFLRLSKWSYLWLELPSIRFGKSRSLGRAADLPAQPRAACAANSTN